MPHITTKLNCDGDKCGACEHFKTKVSFYESPCSQEHDGAVFKRTECKHFKKRLHEDNRLPECLAGELVVNCHTCGRRDSLGQCLDWALFDECGGKFIHWKPATKGER